MEAVVAVPIPFSGVPMQIYGRYNWTLGSEYAKDGHQTAPYASGNLPERVLALSPRVDLSRTRNMGELASILAGLLQLAHSSNRTLYFPEVPCQAAWLHDIRLVNDQSINTQLCVAPTFWRDPYR